MITPGANVGSTSKKSRFTSLPILLTCDESMNSTSFSPRSANVVSDRTGLSVTYLAGSNRLDPVGLASSALPPAGFSAGFSAGFFGWVFRLGCSGKVIAATCEPHGRPQGLRGSPGGFVHCGKGPSDRGPRSTPLASSQSASVGPLALG